MLAETTFEKISAHLFVLFIKKETSLVMITIVD